VPHKLSEARHRRAVAMGALAVAVMALAGAAYLHPNLTSPLGTPASTPAHPVARPISVPAAPRSGGLIGDGATSVLIQQYRGLSDQPPLGLLAWVRISDSGAIRRLVHELNALPAYPSGGMLCADGDGAYFAVDLTYDRGTSTTVRVDRNGCQRVYFGRWEQPVAWAFNSPRLFDTLGGLLAHTPGILGGL
jgi:hypothetical protein